MAVIGVGIDVVDIDRFAESLDRTPGLRTRLFTESEASDSQVPGSRPEGAQLPDQQPAEARDYGPGAAAVVDLTGVAGSSSQSPT